MAPTLNGSGPNCFVVKKGTNQRIPAVYVDDEDLKVLRASAKRLGCVIELLDDGED